MTGVYFPQFYLLVSHYTDTHLFVWSLVVALVLKKKNVTSIDPGGRFWGKQSTGNQEVRIRKLTTTESLKRLTERDLSWIRESERGTGGQGIDSRDSLCVAFTVWVVSYSPTVYGLTVT
jgi:hypothetical protein